MTPVPYGRPGDRRAFPRVQCALDCAVSEIGAGRLLNLSVDGAFVAFAGEVEMPADPLHIRFELDEEPIQLIGEVVRSSPIVPRGTGFGIQFRDVAEPLGDRLHRFVLGRLLTEIAEVMEDNPAPLDPNSVKVLRGHEAVLDELRGGLSEQGGLEGVLFQRDVAELVDVRLTQAGSQRLLAQIKSAAAAHPRVGDHVHLSLHRGHANVHFHTQVLLRSGTSLVLEVPPSLTRFELRRAPRRVPGPGSMFVEIPVPYPPGRRLRREVLDISATGLAFRCQADEVYFLPGTPLREIVITGVKGGGEERRSAQVMHVTAVDDDIGGTDHLRVGVDFGIADVAFKRGVRPRPSGQRKTTSFLSRMTSLLGQLVPRRAAASGVKRGCGPDIEVIRFPNQRREEIVAILNTTPREDGRRLRAPVIIIPPAHGKRKESTSGLALTLVENFARRNRDVVVIRYDGVRNLGESYKDPDCRVQGREAMRMSLSQGVSDLQATLDYIDDNPHFSATSVIVVSFSLQAVIGRRVLFEDRGRRISHWVTVNGAPYARDLICNAAGGVDYLGQKRGGARIGDASILGVFLSGDAFCADALEHGLAFAEDAVRELPAIAVPITWILGRYDAWVDAAIVRDLMARPSAAERTVIELDCGHIPLNSEEALELFQTITRAIWRGLEGEEIEPVFPPWREFLSVRNAEWKRTPRSRLPDKRAYWAEYLMGGGEQKISYDVLCACDEYLRFLDRQADLLGVGPGDRVADMGCGTGNFFAHFSRRNQARARVAGARLTLVDFVPQALAAAKGKLEAGRLASAPAFTPVEARCVSLELSPVRIFRAFLAGDFYGYDPLKGTMKGLGDYSIEMWKAMDNWRLHDVLRGRALDDEDRSFLKSSFPADERDVVTDVNRICRWILGRWQPADLTREGRRRATLGEPPRFTDLRLARLEVRDSEALERLPFVDGAFDRIVSSLVLSYLENPLETLREFHRCLAPGGRLVVSTMRPDVDMSRIYQNLLLRLERGDAVEIPPGISREEFIRDLRAFLSSAAYLLKLAEEGLFAFFSRDELRHLVERAGFRRVETFEAFGDPPQAYVTVGYR